MQLAHRERLITRIAEGLRQRRQRGRRLKGLENAITMGARWRARHQGAPRRDADRALGVGVDVAYAVVRQLVQRRRLHHGVASDAQERSRPMVGRDQKNVRIVRHVDLYLHDKNVTTTPLRRTEKDAATRRVRQ